MPPFAPKRHVFAIARREADKRGFTRDSGKLLQLLTDGDEDLATYAQQYFPEASHTVDVVPCSSSAASSLTTNGSPSSPGSTTTITTAVVTMASAFAFNRRPRAAL